MTVNDKQEFCLSELARFALDMIKTLYQQDQKNEIGEFGSNRLCF